MSASLELKGTILGAISALAAVGIAFAVGQEFRPKLEPWAIPPVGSLANHGYILYLRDCARCHGVDARGDDGPDLHGVLKSDQRLAKIIRNGFKDEMPTFSAKLNDADTQALVAFLQTLRGQ